MLEISRKRMLQDIIYNNNDNTNDNEHSTSTNIANNTNGNHILYIYTLYICTQESTNYITHILIGMK